AALMFSASGVLLLTVFDTLRGSELLDWLRAPDGEPPRLPGLWGEAAHRIHRVLRLHERELVLERDRLAQFLSGIDASPNGVIMLDANEQITWVSAVAASHFGLDPQRDLAQRITNLVRVPA